MGFHTFDKNYHLDDNGYRNKICGCMKSINLRRLNKRFWPYDRKGSKKFHLSLLYRQIKFEERIK